MLVSFPFALFFAAYIGVDLVGRQYSWLGSIVYVAQLIWQPVSSYLLVRLPVAKYRKSVVASLSSLY